MLRRTARKRKAKGQEIALPRNATTRAEILTTGYQTQTSMSRPSLLLGPTSATASQQSTASADTHTVSSHTYIPDNNIPMQNAGIVGDPVNVWIVGSSIVKHAFVTARDRPGGVNLGLGRLNASFWWQGKGGMLVRHVKGQLRTMKKYEDPPHFLVLHVAGNDLGSSKVGFLRNEIKNIIRWIMKEFPKSKLIWSQILTRLKWRHSDDHKAMDLCRYRINNSIAAFIVSCGGYYIKHPDIHADQIFFESDGVHLSSLGNELWLNILQGAMEHFIQFKNCASTFPC
ncbi:uncharacterized protein LOC134707625 isoform X4 [Mytilus trossulus]|uniref:uncharacterized protein LOC134707625 isoform X4 n=1 Tax=Mytilus trossulus TaxID=6551 RepID=UPI003006D2F5